MTPASAAPISRRRKSEAQPHDPDKPSGGWCPPQRVKKVAAATFLSRRKPPAGGANSPGRYAPGRRICKEFSRQRREIPAPPAKPPDTIAVRGPAGPPTPPRTFLSRRYACCWGSLSAHAGAEIEHVDDVAGGGGNVDLGQGDVAKAEGDHPHVLLGGVAGVDVQGKAALAAEGAAAF